MRRLSLRLIVALLTFIIGVAISGWWLSHHRTLPKSVQITESDVIDEPERQPPGFPEMHACGPTANFHTYESPDGVLISQSNEGFSSLKRANRELQKRLRIATEIIERGPYLDDNGRRVGKRVVAVSSGKEGQQRAFILWTDGEILSSIEASSLRHVLEFEKH
jgi:hypothetical protein